MPGSLKRIEQRYQPAKAKAKERNRAGSDGDGRADALAPMTPEHRCKKEPAAKSHTYGTVHVQGRKVSTKLPAKPKKETWPHPEKKNELAAQRHSV